MPKISVIVPVYNVEQYIHECVDSILNQSFKDFELILVNDGSPDNCGDICDEYAGRDLRVKVIHKENGGVSSARNKGIKAAVGEYLCFVDSDDFIEVDYFESIIDYLENECPDLLINNHIKDNSKNTLNKNTKMLLNNNDAIKEMFNKHLYSWEPVACFYKTSICKNILFSEDLCYGEDLLFKYQFIKKCTNKILYLSMYKYHYVFRSDSACNSYNLVKKIDDLKALKFIMENEADDISKFIYRSEYLPRLIKYHKVGSSSKLSAERNLAEKLEKEVSDIWKDVIVDPKIKLSTKLKLIRFLFYCLGR